MLKKLGVIGGMGPEATSFYYARVIARTKAESDQEHINMIILSHATMPARTQAILTGNKLPFLKAITQDARDLEMLGVENIAIPCLRKIWNHTGSSGRSLPERCDVADL